MANAIWPPELPQDVLIQGYHERLPNTKIRTGMDAGPAKQRRRFTAGVRPLRLAVELTRAQVQILDDFHEQTLQGGTLPFDWVHPRTQQTVTFRFVDEPEIPQPESGTVWTALLNLEILP